MVKIPEVAKDGQNWKIYHVKFLEVAATFDCLKVLAGRPYKGDDWDRCNALLCCMFMETVAPSIYFKIHCRTTHENFTAGPHMKTSNTLQNVSVTMIQFPAQMNSNVLAQPQWQRCQRTILRA